MMCPIHGVFFGSKRRREDNRRDNSWKRNRGVKNKWMKEAPVTMREVPLIGMMAEALDFFPFNCSAHRYKVKNVWMSQELLEICMYVKKQISSFCIRWRCVGSGVGAEDPKELKWDDSEWYFCLFIFLSSSFYLVSSAQVLPYEMWYIIVVVNTTQQSHRNTLNWMCFRMRIRIPKEMLFSFHERTMRQIFDGKKWRMEINKFLLIFHLPCRDMGPRATFIYLN